MTKKQKSKEEKQRAFVERHKSKVFAKILTQECAMCSRVYCTSQGRKLLKEECLYPEFFKPATHYIPLFTGSWHNHRGITSKRRQKRHPIWRIHKNNRLNVRGCDGKSQKKE